MGLSFSASRKGGRLPSLGSLRSLPPGPTASAIAGLIVATLILMTPNPLFEAVVVALGVPNLVPAATPPLGVNARIFTALVAALAVGLVAWIALTPYLRRAGRGDESLPRYRRADMHPDAPPRRPLFASDDLGEPLELTEALPDEAPSAEPIYDEALCDQRAMERLNKFIARGEPKTLETPNAFEANPEDAEPEGGWPGVERYFAAARAADAEEAGADIEGQNEGGTFQPIAGPIGIDEDGGEAADDTLPSFDEPQGFADGACPEAEEGYDPGEGVTDHQHPAEIATPGPVFTMPLRRRDHEIERKPVVEGDTNHFANSGRPENGAGPSGNRLASSPPLARLVDQLEAGMARRRASSPSEPGPPPLTLRHDQANVAPDPKGDNALRDALAELERLSARRG